jgi:hypothetical protein
MGEEPSTQQTLPFFVISFRGHSPPWSFNNCVLKTARSQDNCVDAGVCFDYKERVEMLSKHQAEITKLAHDESGSNCRAEGTSSNLAPIRGMYHAKDRMLDVYV